MNKDNKELVKDNLEKLVDLFTDKISELHKIKGGQTERHAFIYYRKLIREMQEVFR